MPKLLAKLFHGHFFGFLTLHLCEILSKINRGIPPDHFEVYYLSVRQNLEPIFMFAFEG